MKEIIIHQNYQVNFRGKKQKRIASMKYHNYAGFTAIITELENKEYAIQASFCSKKDQFCRKTGVEEARKNIPVAVVKIKQIPRVLQRLEDSIHKGVDSRGCFGKYYRVALSFA